MSDKDKKPQDAAQQPEEQSKPKSKLKGPILYGLFGLGAFVICVAAFSFVLGVFSTGQENPTADQAAESKETVAKVDSAKAGKPHAAKATPLDSSAKQAHTEIDSLEKAIYGDHGIAGAGDMDDVLELTGTINPSDTSEARVALPTGLAQEFARIESEKKLIEEGKKELDAQEQRLKQLLAKTDQMEATRVASLAKLYDGMKPQQVAPLIVQLTDLQAVDVLLKMKSANAAKVLESIAPERAARISAEMITLNK